MPNHKRRDKACKYYIEPQNVPDGSEKQCKHPHNGSFCNVRRCPREFDEKYIIRFRLKLAKKEKQT